MAWLSEQELKDLGIHTNGFENILISSSCMIYGAKNIEIFGDNVRIDDFCYISAQDQLIFRGNNHIAARCLITGQAQIFFGKYASLSGGGIIYSSTDDYYGDYLTNPMNSIEKRNVISKKVIVGEHSIIGANTTILPGAYLQHGVAIGANSLLLDKVYPEWSIYAGSPAKFIKFRSKKLLELL